MVSGMSCKAPSLTVRLGDADFLRDKPLVLANPHLMSTIVLAPLVKPAPAIALLDSRRTVQLDYATRALPGERERQEDSVGLIVGGARDDILNARTVQTLRLANSRAGARPYGAEGSLTSYA